MHLQVFLLVEVASLDDFNFFVGGPVGEVRIGPSGRLSRVNPKIPDFRELEVVLRFVDFFGDGSLAGIGTELSMHSSSSDESSLASELSFSVSDSENIYCRFTTLLQRLSALSAI